VERIEAPRRRPRPAEPVDGADHPSLLGRAPEETVGSRVGEQHPSFPPAAQLPVVPSGEHIGGAHRAGPARPVNRRLAIMLACLAAIVLVGGGLEIGSRLGNDGGGAATQQQIDPARPPGGAPGEGPPRPPDGGPAAKPGITVNQPFGDARTTFVVSGRGWQPESAITLTLDGKPVVPKAPDSDKQGAFNYTLNQGLEMYPAGLPPGRHTVQATGAGGQKATVDFKVG
jgi:hypothetical protein